MKDKDLETMSIGLLSGGVMVLKLWNLGVGMKDVQKRFLRNGGP